jgi:hypothetical protein
MVLNVKTPNSWVIDFYFIQVWVHCSVETAHYMTVHFHNQAGKGAGCCLHIPRKHEPHARPQRLPLYYKITKV